MNSMINCSCLKSNHIRPYQFIVYLVVVSLTNYVLLIVLFSVCLSLSGFVVLCEERLSMTTFVGYAVLYPRRLPG